MTVFQGSMQKSRQWAGFDPWATAGRPLVPAQAGVCLSCPGSGTAVYLRADPVKQLSTRALILSFPHCTFSEVTPVACNKPRRES